VARGGKQVEPTHDEVDIPVSIGQDRSGNHFDGAVGAANEYDFSIRPGENEREFRKAE
jgi:hypothetical protein